MTKSMEIRLEGAFLGQHSDPKLQRLMFPWTGTQGPIINGKLIVNSKEDVTLKALTLTFKAKISCNWSEKRGNSTVYYSAKKPLMEKVWVFLEKSEAKMHMLKANQIYTYDFQLALPVNLPNSLAMGTGKIEYMFHANGKRPTFSLDLDRERLIEIYQSLPPSHPHCIYPLQQTADFEQALNYMVQIPKKAFHHGATIPITVKMRPLPSGGARWHVKDMHMKVKEYFWFISPGKGIRPEKRTLVEAKQGSGSWPIQAGPVERILSIQLPAYNIMSTTDTEIIKCTHKLKILFSIEVNGSTRKLSTDFDIYVPGPFPPGQGPMGIAPMQIQAPLQHQLPQHQPPHLMQFNQPLPQVPVQQQPPQQQPPAYNQYPGVAAQQHPVQQPMMQQPMIPHHQPAPMAQPGFQPSLQQQAYPPYTSQPFQAPAQQPPVVPPGTGYPPMTTSSAFSPTPSYQTFPSPTTPYPATPASSGPPAPAAAPNPYSQGYPTPTSGHAYPLAVSSTGYPTPKLPPMPSPTFANANMPSYPMPPPPSPGKPAPLVASPSFMPARIPSPVPPPAQVPTSIPARHSSIISSAAMTAAMTAPTSFSGAFVTAPPAAASVAPPVMPIVSYQEHYVTESPKSSAITPSSNLASVGPGGIKYDDMIKVAAVEKDDTIKVNVDDIKIPPASMTPAQTHSAAVANSPLVVNTAAVPLTPIPVATTNGNGVHKRNSQQNGQGANSRNPQQRHSYTSGPDGLVQSATNGSNGSNGQSGQQSSAPYTPPPFTMTPLQTGPHAPHAIKEPDTEPSLYSYQPPPLSSTTSSNGHAHHQNHPSNNPNHNNSNTNGNSTATTNSNQSDLLNHRFSQMNFTSTLSHQASVSSSGSSSAAGGMVSSASSNIGYVQSPPSTSSPVVKPALKSSTGPMSPVTAAATGAIVASQQQQQQKIQEQQQQQQQLAQQQQPPKKQQIWLPMYQTLGGKTYVQYHLQQ